MSYLALIKKAEEDLKAKKETLESQEPDRPLTDDDTPGVTAADVLRVFGGGRVIEEDKPLSCRTLYRNLFWHQKVFMAWLVKS